MSSLYILMIMSSLHTLMIMSSLHTLMIMSSLQTEMMMESPRDRLIKKKINRSAKNPTQYGIKLNELHIVRHD